MQQQREPRIGIGLLRALPLATRAARRESVRKRQRASGVETSDDVPHELATGWYPLTASTRARVQVDDGRGQCCCESVRRQTGAHTPQIRGLLACAPSRPHTASPAVYRVARRAPTAVAVHDPPEPQRSAQGRNDVRPRGCHGVDEIDGNAATRAHTRHTQDDCDLGFGAIPARRRTRDEPAPRALHGAAHTRTTQTRTAHVAHP